MEALVTSPGWLDLISSRGSGSGFKWKVRYSWETNDSHGFSLDVFAHRVDSRGPTIVSVNLEVRLV